MTEEERVDKGFMYLYANQGVAVYDKSTSELGNELQLLRVLNTLHELGFADRRENTQRTLQSSTPVYEYWINSKGIHFVEKLPLEFKDSPYTYYTKIEKEKSEKEAIKDEADLRVKQITIANSKFQKWVPMASAFIAALSLITTIIVSVNKSEKPYIPLPEMQQLQQTQENINKSIEQYLDTLRKYHP